MYEAYTFVCTILNVVYFNVNILTLFIALSPFCFYVNCSQHKLLLVIFAESVHVETKLHLSNCSTKYFQLQVSPYFIKRTLRLHLFCLTHALPMAKVQFYFYMLLWAAIVFYILSSRVCDCILKQGAALFMITRILYYLYHVVLKQLKE